MAEALSGRERALWVAAAVLAVGLCLAVPGRPVLNNDSFQYLTEAESIAAGRGAVTSLVHFDVEYAHGTLPAPLTTFPPGYPLLVAPLLRLGVAAPWAGTAISAAAWVGLIPLLLWGARRLRLSANATRIVLALAITSAKLLYYGSAVLSEAAFTWLTTAVVVLVIHHETAAAPRARVVALAALGAALAYWVRHAGVFLALGLPAFYGARLVWRRRAQDLTVFGASALALAGVGAGFVRNRIVSGSIRGGNTKLVSQPLSDILVTLGRAPFELLFGEPSVHVKAWFIADVAAALALVWLVWRARRRAPTVAPGAPAFMLTLLAIYTAGITFIALTTPISFEPRLFLPFLPAGLLFVGAGLTAVECARPMRERRLAWTVAAISGGVFYLASNVAATVVSPAPPFPLTRVRAALAAPTKEGTPLHDRIERHVDPRTPVAAVDGQATGFVLQRPTLSLVDAEFSDQQWTEAHTKAVMDQYGSAWLVVYPDDTSSRTIVQRQSPFLRALLAGDTPSWLVPAASNERAIVFQVVTRTGNGSELTR